MVANSMSVVSFILNQAVAELPNLNARRWTKEEDQFLVDNYNTMSETEIGIHLDRSLTSVHLRRERDLNLPGVSKTADVITSYKAAVALGIDPHKTWHWVDIGLIKRYYKPGAPTIRIIKKTDFIAWVVNPKNWIYFDIHKIKDAHLRRLCELRSMRWGDEWWTTPQVADYWKVGVSDVKRYIQFGWMPATHIPVSFGGRNPNGKWSYWRVLRSDAMRVKIYNQGNSQHVFTDRNFSENADRFLMTARNELHLEYPVIAKMMKKKRMALYTRYSQLMGKR